MNGKHCPRDTIVWGTNSSVSRDRCIVLGDNIHLAPEEGDYILAIGSTPRRKMTHDQWTELYDALRHAMGF